MSDNQTVELTPSQQEVLLRGLRFVRRSIMYDVHDPTPEDDADRSEQLEQIALLVDQISGSQAAPASV